MTATTTSALIEIDMAAFEWKVEWALDLVRQWDNVDEAEQLDLGVEWHLTEEILERCLAHERAGRLSPGQQQRFDTARCAMWREYDALLAALGPSVLTLSRDDLAAPARD